MAVTPGAGGVTNTENPAAVLSSIPGWQDATYRELAGGLTNRTYLVESDGKRGVLKIDGVPRSSPYNSRVEEARVQKQAASVQLAGDVIYAEDTIYLAEFVEGKTWTRDDFEVDQNLVDLSKALQRLHSLPLTGRSFDARAAAHDYRQRIQEADPVLVEQFVTVIESMQPPKNLCCCHNDLVAANIISTPEVRLLDWEYACDNDPLFDLATIVAHHELTNRQAELLLDTYFGGDGTRWRRYLADQERLYDALRWLWTAARA